MIKIKYTEFEAKVKEVAGVAEVAHKGNTVYVRDSSGQTIFHVSGNFTFSVYTIYNTWRGLKESTQAELYRLAYELTTTPLDEREEPKKYYYRLPYVDKKSSYLNYDMECESVFYDHNRELYGYQTKFTRKEYAAIAKEKGIPDGYHIAEEVSKR